MSCVVPWAPGLQVDSAPPPPAKAVLPRADEIFGAGGWLESRLPLYQPRHSQLAMACEVEATLARGG